MYSESQTRLYAKADSIKIQDIGLLSVDTPRGMSGYLMGKMVKLLVAQCLTDIISTTPLSLCIRMAFPDMDLRFAGGYDAIRSRGWRQPPIVAYNTANREALNPTYPNITSDYGNNHYNVYWTDRNCDNDRKCYMVIGFENVGIQDEVYVDSISLMRSQVKIVDIVEISSIVNKKIIFLQHPVIYKRGDNMNVVFNLKNNAAGHYDNLKMICLVGESLGTNMTG